MSYLREWAQPAVRVWLRPGVQDLSCRMCSGIVRFPLNFECDCVICEMCATTVTPPLPTPPLPTALSDNPREIKTDFGLSTTILNSMVSSDELSVPTKSKQRRTPRALNFNEVATDCVKCFHLIQWPLNSDYSMAVCDACRRPPSSSTSNEIVLYKYLCVSCCDTVTVSNPAKSEILCTVCITRSGGSSDSSDSSSSSSPSSSSSSSTIVCSPTSVNNSDDGSPAPTTSTDANSPVAPTNSVNIASSVDRPVIANETTLKLTLRLCACNKASTCAPGDYNRQLMAKVDEAYPALTCPRFQQLGCDFRGNMRAYMQHRCSRILCTRGCGEHMPPADLDKHLMFVCTLRPVICFLCSETHPYAESAAHWGENWDVNTQLPLDVSLGCQHSHVCDACDQVFPRKTRSHHRDNVCPARLVECTTCKVKYPRSDLEVHREQSLTCMRLRTENIMQEFEHLQEKHKTLKAEHDVLIAADAAKSVAIIAAEKEQARLCESLEEAMDAQTSMDMFTKKLLVPPIFDLTGFRNLPKVPRSVMSHFDPCHELDVGVMVVARLSIHYVSVDVDPKHNINNLWVHRVGVIVARKNHPKQRHWRVHFFGFAIIHDEWVKAENMASLV